MSVKNLKLVDQVKNDTLLKGVALSVYEIICKKPGLTVGEIAVQYAGTQADPTTLGRSRNELAKRVSDLVGWGAIKANGKTTCPYTGRQVNRYVPTGSMPERTERRTEKAADAPSQLPVRQLSPDTRIILSVLRNKAYSVQFSWWLPKSLKITANKLVRALDEVLLG